MKTYGPPFTVLRLSWYPLAPTEAVQDREACVSPAVALKLVGGASVTRRVVELVWLIVPLVPVTVSDSAYGTVAVVVVMVSVDEPDPVMEPGLNPALAMPVGNPDSLPTERLTAPVNPLRGVTVTVKAVVCPGMTTCEDGLTAMEKSAAGGVTVMVRVGGLGSELPLASTSVSEGVYVPAAAKVTLPGF